jgi:hypothetical protein
MIIIDYFFYTDTRSLPLLHHSGNSLCRRKLKEVSNKSGSAQLVVMLTFADEMMKCWC